MKFDAQQIQFLRLVALVVMFCFALFLIVPNVYQLIVQGHMGFLFPDRDIYRNSQLVSAAQPLKYHDQPEDIGDWLILAYNLMMTAVPLLYCWLFYIEKRYLAAICMPILILFAFVFSMHYFWALIFKYYPTIQQN